MPRAALLSVSDPTNLERIAQVLVKKDFVLLATTGTGKYLKERNIPYTPIEEYTGQKEILGGRVKTLHPKIHAGILAKRSEPSHMEELNSAQIWPVDLVIVNLYPFVKTVQNASGASLDSMVELIDVGGPTMLRAAAKNFKYVLPIIDPSDYAEVATALETSPAVSDLPFSLRKRLATKVFATLAQDNLEVARFLSLQGDERKPESQELATVEGRILEKDQDLRYGENPHQKASFYRVSGRNRKGWSQLQGKELSYNNILDTDAALTLIRAFSGPDVLPTAAIFKHLNPCGLATARSLLDALKLAKRGDPRSHFGGVIAFNKLVAAPVIDEIVEDFAEIVVAPAYEEEALEIFNKRKNLRVLTYELLNPTPLEIRSALGGMLIQTKDTGVSVLNDSMLVSDRAVSPEELQDLQFAWLICANVKSNAVVIAKKQMLIATGAGQMSRIDSTELAISKANTHGHDLKGAVAASDAFFPFPDAVETLAKAGVVAIVAPGGAMRDGEAIETAKKYKVSLLFTSDRHFKH